MRINKFIAAGSLLCMTSALSGLSQQPSHSTLRVGLWTLWHDKEIMVAPSHDNAATLRICNAVDNCTSSMLKPQTTIRAKADQLELAPQSSAASVLLTGSAFLSAHGESLTVHNPIRISARNGQLLLAVTLPVEAYVERVVASESGPADSPESLKALAIVVRTFALHVKHNHAGYDLCDSTHCQLLHWGSATGKAAAAHAATLATAGETLWFHKQRAAAWFHQNCGGHTASPSEVWPSSQTSSATQAGMPWLKSQVDTYCTVSGAREWSSTLTNAELTAALSNAGLVRPGWKTITVSRRGEAGRAVALRIGEAEVSAEAFRLAIGRTLGWNKILSTWFEVTHQNSSSNSSADQFTFHGRGSGHGVGLCQAGSAAMASLGRDSSQILAQYFPGADVADESTSRPWQILHAQGFVVQTLDAADVVFLPQLSRAFAQAQAGSGLKAPTSITIRAFHSASAFRESTVAPGFTAAFTEGNWIATQPLATLASRHLLVPIMTHEFLHALIESQASPSTPPWLREGLVEAWADPIPSQSRPRTPSFPKLELLDPMLVHAATEAESQSAHRAAAHYAHELLIQYGRDQVLTWLHNGLPPAIAASLH